MGFREWLAKPRLSDKNWREQAELIGKWLVISVGVIWALALGTDFLERRAMILGASGVPVGDTEWGKTVEFSRKYDAATDTYLDGECVINGSYQVKNIGDLAFDLEKVILELYRFDDRHKPAKSGPATLSAINNNIPDGKLYAEAEIKVDERFGPGNRMDASFVLEFAAPPEQNDSRVFVLTARALGGLPETEEGALGFFSGLFSGDSDFSQFGENDLRITSKTFKVHPKGCTSETGIDTKEKLIFVPIGVPDSAQ